MKIIRLLAQIYTPTHQPHVIKLSQNGMGITQRTKLPNTYYSVEISERDSRNDTPTNFFFFYVSISNFLLDKGIQMSRRLHFASSRTQTGVLSKQVQESTSILFRTSTSKLEQTLRFSTNFEQWSTHPNSWSPIQAQLRELHCLSS